VRTRLFGPSRRIGSLDFETWLKNVNSTVAVKTILRKAKQECLSCGINEHSSLSPDLLARWAFSSLFGKDEKLLLNSQGAPAEKAQRIVCANQPEVTIHTGPYDVAVQGYLKSNVLGAKKRYVNHRIYWTSGMDNNTCAAIITEDIQNRVIISGDFPVFDGSQHPGIQPIKDTFDEWFHAPKLVEAVRRATRTIRGMSMWGWLLKDLESIMTSGRTNTSLSNTGLNICLTLWAIEQGTGFDIDSILESLIMLVNGDDMLASVPLSWPRIDFGKHLGPLGFGADHKYCYDLSEVEFCSMLLVPCVGGHTFVPKPGNILMKLGYTVSHVSDKNLAATMRGACLSLYEQCYVLKPIRYFLDAHLRLLGDGPVIMVHEDWKMKAGIRREPDIDTAEMLYVRYGMTDLMVDMWRDLLMGTKRFGHLESPFFDLMCDRDTNGRRLYWEATTEEPRVRREHMLVATHPHWFASGGHDEYEAKNHNSRMMAEQGNDTMCNQVNIFPDDSDSFVRSIIKRKAIDFSTNCIIRADPQLY